MIVAFEGLPGAGKTTSAELLAESLSARRLIESTQQHPFLESVYRDEGRHDLEVELAFLLLHASAWRAIEPTERTVSDFSPVKDMVFARDMLTDRADLELFEAAYERLNEGSPHADIVIFLRATPELSLARVRARYERDEHRRFEQSMELKRLRRIERHYQSHHDELGRTVLDLDLDALLRPGEDEERSKRRVAHAALERLRPHLAP
jgi:deoxyadenosine/deoxycytidine kinase